MGDQPWEFEPVASGELIAERFEVVGTIARGGMAEVYEADDRKTGRRMALKVLKPEIAHHKEAVERFRREGEVLRALAHPAIVQLESFGELDDGRLFLAMERMVGETLGARMRRGPMEAGALASIMMKASRGLAAAHERGIVHRDLKPDNLFLVAGEDQEVKLLDFGISQVKWNERITHTGEVLGTPRYMAPEQLAAERDLDARTDVYALGVVTYEALAGSPPYVGANPNELIVAILQGEAVPLEQRRPDLSSELGGVVGRAMARQREDRFSTAPEFAEALAAAVGPAEEERDSGTPRFIPTASLGSMESAPDTVRGGSGLGGSEEEPRPQPLPRESVSVWDEVDRRDPSPPVPRADDRLEAWAPVRSGARWLPRSRWASAVVGLVAGVAVAATVLVSWRECRAGPHPSARARVPSASPPVRSAQAATGTAPLRPGRSDGAADIVPDAGSTDAAARLPRREPNRGTRRGGRRLARSRRARRRPTARKTVLARPAPESPRTLLAQARDAVRRGAPEACIDFADRALSGGGGLSALKLKGECLLRVGRREEALSALQRFCRMARDHPAAGEVRAWVRDLGGRCEDVGGLKP